MRSFVPQFACVFACAMLLASAAGHVRHPRRFLQAIRGHRAIPRGLVWPAAVIVTLVEVGIVALALTALGGAVDARVPLGAAAVLGIVFLVYLMRLLMRESPPATCGCSPVDSPLTPAALIPAFGLTAIPAAGLAMFEPSWNPGTAIEQALAVLCAMTMALLTVLAPAAAPEMHKVRR
jgi:hypothetical protein